jgi:hypothetical protein
MVTAGALFSIPVADIAESSIRAYHQPLQRNIQTRHAGCALSINIAVPRRLIPFAMPSNPRKIAALFVACLLVTAEAALALPPRNPNDLGWLIKEAPSPVVANARRDLLPAKVFEVAIDGTVTFAQAIEELGGTVVRKFDESDREKDDSSANGKRSDPNSTPRFICYRSTRSTPAVVAIYLSRSTTREDVIDGFAFGLLSTMPSATKLCRQVPWLKAIDLRFDKVPLDMPQESFLHLLGLPSSTDEQVSAQWKGQTDALAPVSAVFKNGKLIFLRVFPPTH